ncbi:hypothetical protein DFQ30_006067 [Apophysomyces sp. BC1015]|nr:hypothetical protein DFQ30_006067 [Apophysomyces sp. BC1015]KAG0177311.1 hypothetical protein DFQ29_004981 [Apophysomyces sp. BC1021]
MSVLGQFYENALGQRKFNKLLEPHITPWKEEPACQKLMDALTADDLDPRDLCQIIRNPVIDAPLYRPMVHYDLSTIELIAGQWIDLMCSPRNHIALTCNERTSALDGAILILQSSFTRFK